MKPCLSCEGIHVGATAKPSPSFYTDGAAFYEVPCTPGHSAGLVCLC